MSTNAIVKEMPLAIQRRDPASLIELAIQKGASADELAKLMELQLRWEANEARIAYIGAMQAFRDEAPKLIKSKHVEFANKGGDLTKYDHAELDRVADTLAPVLRKHGLTASWRTGDQNGRILVTCIVTHKQGHVEEIATLSGPADTSGGKNSVQGIGSTSNYLQRYTLFAGLGLVAHGSDDDGRSAEGMPEDAITDYCIQMQDAGSFEELKKVWAECYTKAKHLNDQSAKARLNKVYEARKRELI